MAKQLSNNQILIQECIKQEHLEYAPDMSEDSYFEIFSINQLLKNYDLNDDEVMNGITDGGNDGGCDGMYIFLNNDLLTEDQMGGLSAAKGSSLRFIIIQAKRTHGFGEDPIMKWKCVVKNLMCMDGNIDDYQDRYNESVRASFMLFRDVLAKLVRNQLKIQIQFFYVTLGTEVHPNTRAQGGELHELVTNLYPSAKVEVNFVGADELMNLYNSEEEVSINLKFTDQPIAIGHNNEFVALVDLPTYYEFITDKNGNLRTNFFEANVRDYQGKNSVNASIAETLRSESEEDFWWFNNGVTILSEKVTLVTAKELLILNPEIVNGLQTSNEIYNYFSENIQKKSTDKRHILVRVLVPADESSRDNIIFATNNQTNIPKSSLRVTDTIHLQIEMYFKSRGLYYDRRKNYYKNNKKKPADIVSVSFLAQCMISIFLCKPDFARARPSTLLTDDETYNRLYESNHDLDVFYKTALLGKKVQNYLKRVVGMSTAERSDILFYLLYGVVVSALRKESILFSDVKNLELDVITDDLISNVNDIIYGKYKELGGNGRVAKSSNFIDEINKLLPLHN